MHENVDVLWTGGWDSTFRVLFASIIEKKEVRPHYVIDPWRGSTLHELRAIANIRHELEKVDNSAANRIQRLQIVAVNDILFIPEITAAHRRLKKRAHLGDQYDWLCRYARQKEIRELELCVHVDDKAHFFLADKAQQRVGGGWELSGQNEDDVAIFSCFFFPILDLTKLNMRDKAKQHSFLRLLELSWFCHTPLRNGTPCGTCNPCMWTIEEGLRYRLPDRALRNYKNRHIIKAARKTLSVSRRAFTKTYNILSG